MTWLVERLAGIVRDMIRENAGQLTDPFPGPKEIS
jgi:hypothetical protein